MMIIKIDVILVNNKHKVIIINIMQSVGVIPNRITTYRLYISIVYGLTVGLGRPFLPVSRYDTSAFNLKKESFLVSSFPVLVGIVIRIAS